MRAPRIVCDVNLVCPAIYVKKRHDVLMHKHSGWVSISRGQTISQASCLR